MEIVTPFRFTPHLTIVITTPVSHASKRDPWHDSRLDPSVDKPYLAESAEAQTEDDAEDDIGDLHVYEGWLVVSSPAALSVSVSVCVSAARGRVGV